MGFLERLFGRQEVEDIPTEHVMHITPHDSITLRSSPLRKGMWVRYEGRTGILTRAFNDATGEVHIVNDQGETILIEPHVTLLALAQASYEDIPEPRRPSEDVARKGGYLK